LNPRDFLDLLERKQSEGLLDEAGLALLALVRHVVARLDVLDELLLTEQPKGISSEEFLTSREEEIEEYVELMGPSLFGELKPLPPPESLGVTDAEIALANREIFRRREEAREKGWLIEAIALTAYQLEGWLRIWIVSRGSGPTFHPDDRHQLGHLIEAGESTGLDEGLLARLQAFNLTRNRAIHRLLRGEIAYEDLAPAYDADSALPGELTRWVIQHLPTFEEASPEWDAIGRWMRWAAEHPEL